ncbi:uncharacterized protein LOC108732529 isoform X2 [Agrilus planipennis]|uniref:Uncharacterized protein LOC108732529 isoform X2 n=1 Tax=Agrilus planipennis TaxID=224129 RepID=A0A1W4W417_AGRPL|nr:uncharacterized protein LOC108732529 isoform X2 [Agrilus planipennis]
MDTDKRNKSTDCVDSEEERDVFDVKESDNLYQEVRDILSQLTSKNFQNCFIKIRSLKINTCEELHGIVNLLFEEIMNYESCALLCRELVLMPMLKSEELKKKFGVKFTTFRMLLYIRCEVELKKILNDDEYLINLMFIDVYYNTFLHISADVYYTSEEQKEFHNEGKQFHKQLNETSITFIKFLGELYRQFVITNDILRKFMVNVIVDMGQKYLSCINYLSSAIGEELRKNPVYQQTSDSKVIKQETDDKHVPEEKNASIRPLTPQTDIQDTEKLYPMEAAVYTVSASSSASEEIGTQNKTMMEVPQQESRKKRQRSKQLTVDPGVWMDPVKTAVCKSSDLVSPVHETISQNNTAIMALPKKSKQKQLTLIVDPVTGRKMYKLVEKQEENKLNLKSNPSSVSQPVESAKTKEELHKIVNKTITKLTSSSLKSTVDRITSLKVNTYEYVKYVIEIIMERTINKFESCALLCKELDQMQVPTLDGLKGRMKMTTFHELLLARCVEDLYNVPCLTEEEIATSENEAVISLRLKHVGLVHFMRELHKNQILTDESVVECVVYLLKTWRTKSEGNLECVCRLLLMFGEELEARKVDLNSHFNTLKQICNNKQKISSMLRLISQSLHDLWKAKWAPEKREICQMLQNAYNPRMTKTELCGITVSLMKKQALKRIKLLQIDTYEQLNGVVTVIFSKASVCPEFCLQVCMALLHIKVPCIKNDSLQIVDIQRALRNKCEKEKGSPGFTKLKPGFNKFIGFLFEKELITSAIVVKWIAKLLKNVNENSLVSAHELLVQVGERLEKNGIDLSPHYNRINGIVQKEPGTISNNVLIKLGCLLTWRNAMLSLQRVQPPQFQTITNQPNNDVQHKLFEGLQKLTLSNNSSETISQYQTVPQQIKVITKNGIQTKDIIVLPDHSAQQIHGKGLPENSKWLKDSRIMSQSENNISLSDHSQNDKQLPSTSKITILPNNEKLKLEDVSNGTASFAEVHKKLLTLFSVNTPINEVIQWIQTNIGEAKEEEAFVRALMTAILQQCIVNNKLNDQAFKNFYQYIHRLYIGSSDSVEIYCLYAIQTLCYKLGFPEGLLLTTFKKLYEDSIILPESFLTWKACSDPTKQAGKEEYDELGRLQRTCQGEIAVNKCEGTCNSQVQPSVITPTGFLKECYCCRESFLRERIVTLTHCYDPDGMRLTTEDTHSMDVKLREPSDCKCYKCGEYTR